MFRQRPGNGNHEQPGGARRGTLAGEEWEMWLERSTGTRSEGYCNPTKKLRLRPVGVEPKEGCEQKSALIQLEGYKGQVGLQCGGIVELGEWGNKTCPNLGSSHT